MLLETGSVVVPATSEVSTEILPEKLTSEDLPPFAVRQLIVYYFPKEYHLIHFQALSS